MGSGLSRLRLRVAGGVAVGQVNDDLVPREARARWGDEADGSAFALPHKLV